MQFYVDRQHLLVRGAKHLVGGFQFLSGDLEVFFFGPQLLLELHDTCIGGYLGVARFFKGLRGVRASGFSPVSPRFPLDLTGSVW